MAFIASLITAGLFFLVLHYFTEFTKLQKIISSLIVFSIILAAIMFNVYSAAQRKQMLDVVRTFKQGKSVHCDTKEVNATNYTLSIGTYTFIGKKDTPYYTEMISASSCR